MTPITLQDALIERMREVFKEVYLKNANSEQVNINIYPQHLPKKDTADVSLYPFILVKLLTGKTKSTGKNQDVNVGFIIGIYDESNDYQGHRDCLMIVNKLMKSIVEYPAIDDKFMLTDENIEWEIPDEDTFPFYLVGIHTTWSVPSATRSGWEDFI